MVVLRRSFRAAFGVAGLCLAVSLAAEGGLRRYWTLSRDIQQLKMVTAGLRDKNAALQREIDALRRDSRSIEQAVREELGYIRRDEVIIALESP